MLSALPLRKQYVNTMPPQSQTTRKQVAVDPLASAMNNFDVINWQ